MATAQNRELGGSPLESRLHSSAYAGGIDFAHDSDSRVWLFTGAIAGSLVRGSEAALLRTQQTSARYYQRPDAEHIELDSTATSLGGFYAMAYVGKQAGTFTMRNGFAYVSPGYEVNDLGFQSDADRILIDNQSPETVARWCAEAKRARPAIFVEASGNMRLENVRSYAEAGADAVSVGSLTHSVAAADVSLELSRG